MGILSSMFGVERRTHPSNPNNWLLYGLTGSSKSYTGRTVNEEDALGSTAVWAAVRLLSETIGSLPLHLYRRLEKGKERAISHPAYSLLNLKPNPEMTSMLFREAQMGQILRYGFCCAEKELDNAGRIIALWPLLSKNITVKRVRDQLVYVMQEEATTTILPRDKVLHIPGFSTNGISSYSPITKTKEAISLNLALEEYAAKFFGNGAKPPAVIEIPGNLGPKGLENFKKSWKENSEGLDNAHRIAILEEGIKLHEYGADPSESQALESRKFSVIDVARIFNVPPHMLRDLERASFSNIEEQGLEFVIYSLRPWLVRLEQNYTIQMLSEEDQRGYFWEHMVDGLLRGDSKTRWASYMTGFQMGVNSPNDILEMENRNPIEGGDEHFVQVNMMPLSMAMQAPIPKQIVQEPTDEDTEEEEKSLPIDYEYRSMTGVLRLRETFRPLFEEAMQRIVSKETMAVKRGVDKNFNKPDRDQASFDRWLIDFYNTLPEYIIKAIGPNHRAYAAEVYRQVSLLFGAEAEITNDVLSFVKSYTESFADNYVRSSIAQLKALIRDNTPETWHEILNKRLDEWNEKRSGKVADDEVVREQNAVIHETYRGFGVKKIKWVARGDNCPLCDKLNGRIIGIEKAFADAGDTFYFGPEPDDVSFKKPNTTYLDADEYYAGRDLPKLVDDPDFQAWLIKQGKKVPKPKAEGEQGPSKGAESWKAIKMNSTKKHPPIHRGCDCTVVPVFEKGRTISRPVEHRLISQPQLQPQPINVTINQPPMDSIAEAISEAMSKPINLTVNNPPMDVNVTLDVPLRTVKKDINKIERDSQGRIVGVQMKETEE